MGRKRPGKISIRVGLAEWPLIRLTIKRQQPGLFGLLHSAGYNHLGAGRSPCPEGIRCVSRGEVEEKIRLRPVNVAGREHQKTGAYSGAGGRIVLFADVKPQ